MAERIHTLVRDGLGYSRYLAHGGDWGALIGARLADAHPDVVAGLHLTTPSVLPPPADMDDLDDTEQRYVERALAWRARKGQHLFVQSAEPHSIAYGMHDSPVGLAGWLVGKYRAWSAGDDAFGQVFDRRSLCDFLTMYWATGTSHSSMRLYAGELRNRWQPPPGRRIPGPVGVALPPGEFLHPPRAFIERIADVRHWTELPAGGHFAALEEPDLVAADLLTFAADQDI